MEDKGHTNSAFGRSEAAPLPSSALAARMDGKEELTTPWYLTVIGGFCAGLSAGVL